ncbi:MAG: hypothetical protein NC132_04340 [Corallococcus sp.]|nr:hypothetical protein [Corallococcus sp.]MCM1359889.1 hypothetical protein [Corallococcus sp.]MCM1395323.1 hypothetical protein [Corallococcus sp.]
MAEKTEKPHSLSYQNNTLTICGVEQVVEVSAAVAQLKLSQSTLIVRGTGLNIVKLDKAEGVVQLETQRVQQITYRQGGVSLKGLFK